METNKYREQIWLSTPHMSGNEMKYIENAIKRNQVFPLGENVDQFEQSIKEFTGIRSCTCLSSGTAAIHLALIILNIQQGDEVLCSTFTFSASANPICYEKAVPIFIDSELNTWNMNAELLEEAILDRIKKKGKKPKAIILVHLYGMPSDMNAILKVACKYEIPIIEDAAEALGSKYNNKYCGTLGAIGIYSFNGNKIITTSGGGALISDKQEYCEKAKYLATQARENAAHYQHSDIGYNYRMSNILAGIGLGQMEVINDRIQKRRDNNKYYKNKLSKYEFISFQEEPDNKYFSNYWLTAVVFASQYDKQLDRENIRIALKSKNIETRPLWKPMHLQPVFKNYPSYIDGVSENLFRDGLCLPSSSSLDQNTLDYIIDNIIASIK